MSFGMEMMLKNMLGVDPEELKAQIAETIAVAQEQAAIASKRLENAEKMLAVIYNQNVAILARLDALASADTVPETIKAIGQESEDNGDGH